MASHSLAIAKASLAAGLMRPDPHSLCKEWLLTNTASSVAKIGAIGKYLVALSASFKTSSGSHTGGGKGASIRGRQLSVLYLLHDVLHHTRFHRVASVDSTIFCRTLEPSIIHLVALASAYEAAICPKHIDKVRSLVEIWAEGEYYTTSFIENVRDTTTNASNGEHPHDDIIRIKEEAGNAVEPGIGSVRKDAPYIMPLSHGDASLPYYDLPAGNLLPCIVPNSSLPISPQAVKPVQLRAGPADESLVRAVKVFLRDADSIYGAKPTADGVEFGDVDELGQTVIVEGKAGEFLASEGYYGWSKKFCDRMKLRQRLPEEPAEALHDLFRLDRTHIEEKRDASDDNLEAPTPDLGAVRRRKALRGIETPRGDSGPVLGRHDQYQPRTHHPKRQRYKVAKKAQKAVSLLNQCIPDYYGLLLLLLLLRQL
ncbi:MAG: hypothetical protein Q9222_000396 [Ikaeria aurantiellina]